MNAMATIMATPMSTPGTKPARKSRATDTLVSVFSGMSGSAVADAAGLGQIEHKAMVDNGYRPDGDVAHQARAKSNIRVVMPPVFMRFPARMKNGTASSVKPVVP